MQAVSHQGVPVCNHLKPTLNKPTDPILPVTTRGICGSNLHRHRYDGRTPLKPGTVLGHEIMGVIDEVGRRYKALRKGSREAVRRTAGGDKLLRGWANRFMDTGFLVTVYLTLHQCIH
jgi:threonine dehydrogenase-like Zn-dependent dehydrogenase